MKTKFSPHILRHIFATKYLARGGNVFYFKEIMRHASLLTTLKYTHIQPQDLQSQHLKFPPVAHLRTEKFAKRTQGEDTCGAE